ncbi:unnamed protein product [Bemisia tabaci]|uniref:Uncharacterized protein n=2 Tax=Bemisia tabaci TaxID=7038 RepID=A0A9N9ZZ02_BEMTA|nr:PREDICTED: uncharacterized protein LOC109040428 isoform X2 [Bemisia tabaci]XP_018911912.1 PREDICTED: uncharacterized protein LOC109040428 isoform X2 [Bemisia tabaci]XP_018911913.1 PREDICTED: uncharacterized protein LOC109040428 isoform X2 [Bemisia tabaci]XP_018911914.1 PREDICTED: uncharacterized protein LOC109040428 isoform X2 [Bemisia tabaci]XP_018911917.1 PREDICTED: uncharacterized protein LOC109040428 isoform X2 [Bemisia tabaci]CAH0382641.1 unnamed protein product [Bemisia tabaci]
MYVAIWPTRKFIPHLGIVLIISSILVYYYSNYLPLIPIQGILTDVVDDAFFVKTSGCRISRLDPFDPSILGFLEGFGVNCAQSEKSRPPLLDLLILSNSTKNFKSNTNARDNKFYTKSHTEENGYNKIRIKLVLVESGCKHYNISPEDRRSPEPLFFCIWQPFNRKTPNPQMLDRNIDDAIVYGSISQPFTHFSLIPPEIEFVRAICYKNDTEIYKDFFFIPSGNPTFFETSSKPLSPSPRHGVLLYSLDAVSRLNFIREMPLFHHFLREHGAIDFVGYHKVGDNTFPNLIPLVLGLSEGEIKSSCWPNKSSFFDNCPFVWKEYRSKGFITAFVEDEPSISGFNYLKNGFQKQPTDYYLRPLYIEKQRVWGHSAGIGSNTKLCIGSDLNVKFLLDQIFQILSTVQRPKFGFFWETSLTHDYSCLPRLGDQIFKDFFDKLSNAGLLQDNFIILLSDHGLRWGDIRNTYQGRIEERMPFLFLLPPPWFKNEFPLAYQNLKRNSNKLTTPYDVHATLLDLLDLEQISNSAMLGREKNLTTSLEIPHAFSLFTPVSSTRSCASAHIPADYCVCHDTIRNLPNNDPHAHIAASVTVAHLNSILSNSSLCAKLHLYRVRNVQVERSLNMTVAISSPLEFWSVSLETIPGNGMFESTLRRRGEEDFEVIGTVSRTNLYRGQSECISDYHLRLYCYCI